MNTEKSHIERVRAALGGQSAPEAAGGGARILWRCGTCGRPWFMDGARAYPRLSDEQLARIASELHADIATLPYATCAICGAQAIGEVNIDQYGVGDLAGFGISWEGVEPTGAHCLGVALRVDWLEKQRAPHSSIVTDFARCRAFLDWLARVRVPESYHRMTAADSAEMARTNTPGHGAPGTDGWQWSGAIWHAPIHELGGLCYISLATALPMGELPSLALLFTTWRQLAAIVQLGSMAGETHEE